jgi:hypothetical protein
VTAMWTMSDLGMPVAGHAKAFEPIAHDLVLRNKLRIFPDSPAAIEILDIELGPRKFVRGDRYHRRLAVRYRSNGALGSTRLWLKFRPQLDRLLPVRDAYHERLSVQIFPRAYFAWCSRDDDMAVLATACVRGAVLRNKLLTLGLFRRTARLLPILGSNGSKMRQFHDAFAASGSVAIGPLVASTAGLVRDTPAFSAEEKASVLSHLGRHAHALSTDSLPAVKIHNDWILRNIMVAADGTDYVVDCDSMRGEADLRWLDVAYFLLNIESQMKWFPLVTVGMLSQLWREFWRGYAGESGIPDGLTPEQVTAILYIVRLRYLLGGTSRPAYFTVMDGLLDHRVLGPLRESVVMGRATQLDLSLDAADATGTGVLR